MENSQQHGGAKDIKTAYRTAYLIAGFLKQTLTEEEKDELDEWILASDANMILFEKMTDDKNIMQAKEWMKKMNVEDELQNTKRKIAARRFIRAISYAAAVVIIAAGIYFLQRPDQNNEKTPMAQAQDILPGSDKATLLLDNGKVVVLGNSGADTAINEQVKILRSSGQVVYNSSKAGEIVYHTLNVPRKGQYKLTLADGSKVWLNSESSIRYPVSFSGNERKVFVTGETYFEVEKNKSKPFRVVSGDVTIEALGTQFNVNAYSNEPFLSTTLVEGSVMVTKGTTENILKPGQQARLTENDFQITKVNIDSAVAWKDNKFKFINTPIDAIMRQIERWYDADVEYKDAITLHLNATIGRDVPVSKLLHIFEETEQVKFKVDGKKIIVTK